MVYTHNYRLSYSEWLAGIRFARKRDAVSMLRFIVGWAIPALLLYLLVAIAWDAFHNQPKLSTVWPPLVTLAFLLFAILSYRVMRKRRLFKRAALLRNKHGISIAFNDEYFVAGLPARSESRFLWPALYDFAENKTVALVYFSKKTFVIVPKHAMPEEFWIALRALAPQRKPKVHAD